LQPNTHTSYALANRSLWAGFVLVILYMVGIAGLNLPQTRPLFLKLVPLNLIITTAMLLVFGPVRNGWFWLFSAIIAASGICVEWLGVSTGKIFGVYAYGHTLGPLVAGKVPWVIGANWLMLVYATGSAVSRLPVPDVLKCITAALLMTLLDVLIEPVAMRFDFWFWQYGTVPLLNYGAWFVISGIMQALFFSMPFNKQNRLAGWVYGVQVFFFLANTALVFR